MFVAGNTGVTPFLTLLLVGIIERTDPEILNMGERLDGILASDIGLGVLATATLLEFVSMCVPIVDEMVDGAMTFIIPFISAVASMSTFGLFGVDEPQDGNERVLKSTGVGPFQVILIGVGLVLALCLHFFKMIVRFFGVGWATGCFTILETIWTICSFFIAIFIQPVSIFIAVVLLCVAAYSVYRFVLRIQKRRNNNDDEATNNARVDAEFGYAVALERAQSNAETIRARLPKFQLAGAADEVAGGSKPMAPAPTAPAAVEAAPPAPVEAAPGATVEKGGDEVAGGSKPMAPAASALVEAVPVESAPSTPVEAVPTVTAVAATLP